MVSLDIHISSGLELSIEPNLLIVPVEIAEEVDEEQCFLFGHLTPDVDHVRYLNKYQAMPLQERCAELAKVRAFPVAMPYQLLTVTYMKTGLRRHQGWHVWKRERRQLHQFALHRRAC